MKKGKRTLWDALDQAPTPLDKYLGQVQHVIDTVKVEDVLVDPFKAAPAPSKRTSLPPAGGFKFGNNVIPVAEFKKMTAKAPKEKKPRANKRERDYEEWNRLPIVNVQNEGRQVIAGNIPSKSNSYKIITLPGAKQDCPDCVDLDAAHKMKCGQCDGTGQIQGHPHSSLGKTADLRKYEKMFFQQCGGYKDKMLEGHFELEGIIYFPTMRSDLDGCLKILLDCLQTVRAVKNDNQCMHIDIRKQIDKENPRIEFKIVPL
jgi:hypothetical protein